MLIGLTGRAGAGKDTVYETLAELYGDQVPVERRSFADPLYESAAAALGVTADDLRRWKRDPAVRVAVGFRPPGGPAGMATSSEVTVRTFLQRYGTEAHRDIFGADFWVNIVSRTHHGGRVVVVTDVRFPNEAASIRRAGGVVVRVIGPDDGLDTDHASEVPLPDYLVDRVLHNEARDDDRRLVKTEVTNLVAALYRHKRWAP